MSLRRALLMLAVPALLLAGCGNDDDDDADANDQEEPGEPAFGPDAGIGEAIDYRGARDTDAEWQAQVTVEGVECDVEIDTGAEGERHCAVRLVVENTGDEPTLEGFTESSALQADNEDSYTASEAATGEYNEAQGTESLLGVEPGETREGYLVFAIPEDAEPTYLQLLAGSDDQVVVVDLSG
jgi:hypothetical protein